MTSVLIRHTQGTFDREPQYQWGSDGGSLGHKPRAPGAPRGWRKQEAGAWGLREGGRPTRISDFWLQNAERMNFCFKPPSERSFVTAVLQLTEN